MNIKAFFPSGATQLTVNGLHQWDYGRKIEVHADDLPALVEVHFACAGMSEAVVRSCAVIDGIAEAAVPDRCLEQTTPITAWVYEVGETSGETVKTITLPIIPRARPKPGEPIPEDVGDKYTEAIAAMTALVEDVDNAFANTAAEVLSDVSSAIEGGALIVAKASKADHATKATDADYATEAFSAHECDFASTAEKAGALTGRTTTPGDAAEEVVISEPGVYLVYYRLHDDASTVRRANVFPVLDKTEDVTQLVAADRYLCYRASTNKIYMSASPSGILCTAYFYRLVRLNITR